jgi:hypothetical protein
MRNQQDRALRRNENERIGQGDDIVFLTDFGKQIVALVQLHTSDAHPSREHQPVFAACVRVAGKVRASLRIAAEKTAFGAV